MFANEMVASSNRITNKSDEIRAISVNDTLQLFYTPVSYNESKCISFRALMRYILVQASNPRWWAFLLYKNVT